MPLDLLPKYEYGVFNAQYEDAYAGQEILGENPLALVAYVTERTNNLNWPIWISVDFPEALYAGVRANISVAMFMQRKGYSVIHYMDFEAPHNPLLAFALRDAESRLTALMLDFHHKRGFQRHVR